MLRPKNHSRPGFTLIELLVVVVIIGILAGVAVQGFGAAQDRSRNSSMTTNVRTTFLGIESWRSDRGGGAVPKELIHKSGADGIEEAVAMGKDNETDWPRYVPGGRLPIAPWCNQPQVKVDGDTRSEKLKNDLPYDAIKSGNGVLAIEPDGSFRAGALQTGEPENPPEKAKNYGYLYYVGHADTGRYAVFGVGKKGKEARVFSVRTNFQ